MSNFIVIGISLLLLVPLVFGSPNFGEHDMEGQELRSTRDVKPGKHWFSVILSHICGGATGNNGPAMYFDVYLKEAHSPYTKVFHTKTRNISPSTFKGEYPMAFHVNYAPKIKQLIQLKIYFDTDNNGKNGELFGTITDVPIYGPDVTGKEFDIVTEENQDAQSCGDEKSTAKFEIET